MARSNEIQEAQETQMAASKKNPIDIKMFFATLGFSLPEATVALVRRESPQGHAGLYLVLFALGLSLLGMALCVVNRGTPGGRFTLLATVVLMLTANAVVLASGTEQHTVAVVLAALFTVGLISVLAFMFCKPDDEDQDEDGDLELPTLSVDSTADAASASSETPLRSNTL